MRIWRRRDIIKRWGEVYYEWKREKKMKENVRKEANRIIFNDSRAITENRNALLWSENLIAVML